MMEDRFNGCILSFGPPGSGKSTTMFGSMKD
jgi:type II secretory ATPase GspE/PulE/Tfp pilus assembly ATPase PilB-like protein